MKLKRLLLVCTLIVLFADCNTFKKSQVIVPQIVKDTMAVTKSVIIDNAKTDSFFINLLQQYPQYFAEIIANRKAWNVQVIYTEINRDENNVPHFVNHYFNVDSSAYFYPASTVKLPTALLALQRLHELKDTGIKRSTTMITEAAYSGQTETYNDPQTEDGRPTIESYIKRIFLVSDNEAFNRLYEFLGQKYINDELHKRGFNDAQILHRLDIFLSEDENRHTNPVKFLDSNNNVFYSQPLVFNEDKYAERHDSLGEAHFSGGELLHSPMNFSKKNRISLEDLHQIMRSVIFPESVPAAQRFNITDSDYFFARKYMSQFPGESNFPAYDSANYPDAYGKFLLYGSRKEPLPKDIRIFNKEGDAYGELLDIAYIVDFDKNIEFFLSAAINCNTNGIINDDNYAYDTLGFPFMKNLGEVIYKYESKRKKQYEPNLSSFKIIYNK
ncbi:MAG: serine hydrolase [Ginsengibacter sp.]